MTTESKKTRRHILLSDDEVLALGARIKAYRLARLWSLRELGRRAAVQAIRLSRMEKGCITPKLSELLRIAGALGAGLDEIVRGAHTECGEEKRTVFLLLREVESLAGPGVWTALESLLQTLVTVLRAHAMTKERSDAER